MSTHFSGQSARNALEEPEAKVLHLHTSGAILSTGNHIRRGNVVGSAGSQRTSPRAAIAEGDDHALACQGRKIRAPVGVLQKARFIIFCGYASSVECPESRGEQEIAAKRREKTQKNRRKW
jgi:hypothetical protein